MVLVEIINIIDLFLKCKNFSRMKKRAVSFTKQILICLAFSLLPILAFGQNNGTNQNSSIKEYPKFKGVEYQIAVHDYIKYCFRNYVLTNRSNTTYYSVMAFTIREDGSLADASIVQTTGSKFLDNKLLNLCKDFTRKKHMTPAYSEDGPVVCTIEVPLEFNYSIMEDFKNKGRGFLDYRKLQRLGFTEYPRAYFHNGLM